MDVKEVVSNILEDLTGEDLSDQMDENILDSGLSDSLTIIQMLLNLQEETGIQAPAPGFNCEEWDTPDKTVAKVKSLENS